MPKRMIFAVLALSAAAASAHVTPNVQLVKRGEFMKAALPGAVKYFEKTVALGAADQKILREQAAGWVPSSEDTKVYVGRDGGGALVGTTIFLWMPSQHGPVGLAAAFDATGRVLRADVTDVGSEPLDWVRPLLGNGLGSIVGLGPSDHPDAAKIGPEAHGTMSRYYARVIADAIGRAQALDQVLRAGDR